MSSKLEHTASTEAKEPTRELECGHSAQRDSVTLIEVGPVCRYCHTPIRAEKWDDILRTTKVHHRTGETTHHSTWLVGIDAKGRAVYHDTYSGEILRVVPREHRQFDGLRTGNESPMREYSPRRGPGRGKLLTAPDGRDHLVVIDRIQTDSRDFSKEDLAEWVIRDAADTRGTWNHFSSKILDRIEHYTNKYSKYDHIDFPAELGTAIHSYAAAQATLEDPRNLEFCEKLLRVHIEALPENE